MTLSYTIHLFCLEHAFPVLCLNGRAYQEPRLPPHEEGEAGSEEQEGCSHVQLHVQLGLAVNTPEFTDSSQPLTHATQTGISTGVKGRPDGRKLLKGIFTASIASHPMIAAV